MTDLSLQDYDEERLRSHLKFCNKIDITKFEEEDRASGCRATRIDAFYYVIEFEYCNGLKARVESRQEVDANDLIMIAKCCALQAFPMQAHEVILTFGSHSRRMTRYGEIVDTDPIWPLSYQVPTNFPTFFEVEKIKGAVLTTKVIPTRPMADLDFEKMKETNDILSELVGELNGNDQSQDYVWETNLDSRLTRVQRKEPR